MQPQKGVYRISPATPRSPSHPPGGRGRPLPFASATDLVLGSALRIAFWGPLPRLRSGIADYSAELLPTLARQLEVELIVPDGWRRTDTMPAGLAAHPERAFAGLAAAGRFDAVLYQLGNNHEYHASIYHALLEHPGVVVLHEVV